MALFKAMKRIGGRLAKAAGKKVIKKVAGAALRAVPGVGVAYAAYDIGKEAYRAIKPQSGAMPLPPLPIVSQKSTTMKGLPPLGGAFNSVAPYPVQVTSRMPGVPPLPQDRDSLTRLIQAGYIIPLNQCKTFVRSPVKTHVMIDLRKSGGPHFAVDRKWARSLGLWKPADKPPISVGEENALKKAKQAIQKVKKFNGLIQYVDANSGTKGRVKIKRRAKA